jgi:hypothetical protein
MPIQYETTVNLQGNVGKLIVQADLEPLNETAKANGVEAVGVMLSRGQSGLTFVVPFTGTEQFIPFEELIRASEGVNPNESSLKVEWRFEFDPNGARLYPSDLVQQMRQMNVSEEKIQETLEWERTLRGGA